MFNKWQHPYQRTYFHIHRPSHTWNPFLEDTRAQLLRIVSIILSGTRRTANTLSVCSWENCWGVSVSAGCQQAKSNCLLAGPRLLAADVKHVDTMEQRTHQECDENETFQDFIRNWSFALIYFVLHVLRSVPAEYFFEIIIIIIGMALARQWECWKLMAASLASVLFSFYFFRFRV